ncbi:hypothetical protein [Vibrio sp. OPT18]|uniref:hypothetical protein n=1 Tax=Vibrio sp. OPT18 TaxID=2778641 RepID=UPI00187F2E0F|nr:hypothetical protein [Vibrio sp. OPT18]MBE8578687.1 hypothetical protein [Vibrio sp. OPT18]
MSIITLEITDVEESKISVVAGLIQKKDEAEQLSAFVAEALSAGIQMYIKDNFADIMTTAQDAYELKCAEKLLEKYKLSQVVTSVQ